MNEILDNPSASALSGKNKSDINRLASKLRAEEIERRLANGDRPKVIAIDLGISSPRFSQIAKRHGIDIKKYKQAKGR